MIAIVDYGGYPVEIAEEFPKPERFERLTDKQADEIYRSYWGIRTYSHQQHGDAYCFCCNSPATGRSSANVWGIIYDFPTCAHCQAQWNRKWVEQVPTVWK